MGGGLRWMATVQARMLTQTMPDHGGCKRSAWTRRCGTHSLPLWPVVVRIALRSQVCLPRVCLGGWYCWFCWFSVASPHAARGR